MDKQIIPYKNSNLSRKEQVTEMFNNISENYDKFNHIITFGIDISWRKKVVDLAGKNNPKQVLDIATGTGDLAIMLASLNPDKIVGLDISEGMLNIAKQKVNEENLSEIIEMIVGDSENIPFDDNTFDAITVSFGVRNFENLNKGLTEINRVLKPNGTFVVLETSNPTKFPFKQGYKFYTNVILPIIGNLFSKDKNAYTYLSKTANSFPFGEKFNNILKKNGFKNTKSIPLTFGTASIYTSTK
ncbi:MAG: bifunctional demethylmenaquinone methyltransferase/2-methoxy-6-polyprenyl-1,4-benzoquinol methylase UbiE [Tenacibaculum sp.]|nr:bifunctional demethylmenaquinone methyltransferase/2-methoxy-6-polyprenyl-1,4-benzoquinol methylase UbiE [Tenacibaculum sp.]